MSAPSLSAPTVTPVRAKPLVQKYATALTAALFAVVGGSGAVMFFGLLHGELKEAHEWLGLAFVLAAVLHLVRNGRAFVTLARKARTQVLAGAAVLALGLFVVLSAPPGGGGNPMRATLAAVQRAPLPAVAAVLDLSMPDLTARLAAAGVTLDESEAPLTTLAAISAGQGIEAPRLLAALTRAP
ncbi:MAG: DUF4405 domain-containing protein [Hyphomicrobiales bacterium]|nr:DUF4405 domain-containing protein [Hyphomicrobiales bacterium]